MSEPIPPVRLIGLRDALRVYVAAQETQSSRHIKPLHGYIACRLVIEGGFDPADIVPQPPFRIEVTGSGAQTRRLLIHDPDAASSGERTILGGVKTKQVDVTVAIPGIGPCLAISVKGTVGAFRNLTNRMEEAIGDCTNLHISYPNLVYGFLHILKANHSAPGVPSNDVAILDDGQIVDSIRRYHDAMVELTGRKGVRNDFTRYEVVAIALVNPTGEAIGDVLTSFPAAESRLLFTQFFEAMYRVYDHRFVFAAPDLRKVTARREWHPDSPAIAEVRSLGFEPRMSAD